MAMNRVFLSGNVQVMSGGMMVDAGRMTIIDRTAHHALQAVMSLDFAAGAVRLDPQNNLYVVGARTGVLEPIGLP
jgi:hypothetical protein